MNEYKNEYPKFIVKVKDFGPVQENIDEYQDWTGVFYKTDIDAVENHMAVHFPVSQYKEFTFGVFTKESVNDIWAFVKCINPK